MIRRPLVRRNCSLVLALLSLTVMSVLTAGEVHAQASFHLNADGVWSNPSIWTLMGGTDADGIPDADDTVYSGNAPWQGYDYTRRTVTLDSNVEVAAAYFAYDRPGGIDLGGYTLHVTGAFGTSFGGDMIFTRTGGGNLDLDSGATMYQSYVLPLETGDTVDGQIEVVNNGAGLTVNGNITRTGAITLTGNGGVLTMAGGSLTQNGNITFLYGNAPHLTGYGTIDLQGAQLHFSSAVGNVTADGGTLEFTDTVMNVAPDDGEAINYGWRATNGGELKLPSVTISSGASTQYWGRHAADSTALVNSVEMAFTGVTGGALQIAMVDENHSSIATEMALYVSGDVGGIWNFDLDDTFDFGSGSVTLRFRYDGSAVTDENTLELWHFIEGIGWEQELIGIDTVNNFVTATGIDSFSPFVLGNDLEFNMIPEPASVALLTAGAGLLLTRRRGTRVMVA